MEYHDEACERFDDAWTLCFQRCTYHYDDRESQPGYRFIWRRPDGTLQPARGQARIPDAGTLERLTEAARAEGWYG
ncbi:hypothetical protein GBA65_06075 [Rubrobacter marinus]|uniref:Uncharacterized protein n=1 Tax=Rubrobacter marinus TaxID=2653852 RepID=A0A6G8Q2I0_9ACTN|nr:hypothetical protein GBA65_06075 [Rubrobacter marinus]